MANLLQPHGVQYTDLGDASMSLDEVNGQLPQKFPTINWDEFFHERGISRCPLTKSLMDYVLLHFPMNLMNSLLQHTSNELAKQFSKTSSVGAPLTEKDFWLFIGLRLRMCLNPGLPVADYWKERVGNDRRCPTFPNMFGVLHGMSRNRFQAIDKCLSWGQYDSKVSSSARRLFA